MQWLLSTFRLAAQSFTANCALAETLLGGVLWQVVLSIWRRSSGSFCTFTDWATAASIVGLEECAERVCLWLGRGPILSWDLVSDLSRRGIGLFFQTAT